MKIATSRITPQGRVSVPLEVRRRLGLIPGATIQWESDGDTIVVRRAGTHSFADIRKALFPDGPPALREAEDLKKGIEDYVRTRHARR